MLYLGRASTGVRLYLVPARIDDIAGHDPPDPVAGADEESVSVSLEMLSMDWTDVVKAIQDRLARRVILTRPGG